MLYRAGAEKSEIIDGQEVPTAPQKKSCSHFASYLFADPNILDSICFQARINKQIWLNKSHINKKDKAL